MKPLLSLFPLLPVALFCVWTGIVTGLWSLTVSGHAFAADARGVTYGLYQQVAQTGPRKKANGPRPALVPPSVAAKRAQSAFGGKILSVQLRGSVYLVKLRGDGTVREVRVDARSGSVIGR